MNIGPALEAHPQSTELMQPRQRAFDDPAGRSQAAAMWGVASRELRLDVARAQCRTVGFGVIGAVALHALGSMAGATTPSAAHGCDAIDQGDELRDIVGVGASEHGMQRNAPGVGDQMVLASRASAIGRVGAGAVHSPPPTARIEAVSTTARDQSMRSLASSRSSSLWWITT